MDQKTEERVLDTLYGNGRPGLVSKVQDCSTKIETMNEALESLATSYSALSKSLIEWDVTDKLKAKAVETRNKAIQRIGVVFGIVFGAVGALYIILEYAG